MATTHLSDPTTATTSVPPPATPGTAAAAAPAGDDAAIGGGDLQELAKRHLWMHFTRMGSYAEHEVPVIVRGEGCYVYDQHGKRYLDGLSALYCVNIGHGRAELGEAAAKQAKELGFYTNWSYAHPRSIELAARIASARARGPQPRVLHLRRLGGGGERVEAREGLPRRPRGAP